MTHPILNEIRFAEHRYLDAPATDARRWTITAALKTIFLALALLTTGLTVIQQGDELFQQFGIDPWISGFAAVGVWAWACIRFVRRESGRKGA
jgi:hypothetical protein